MPFDVGGAVNAAADWLCGSALVKGIVNNPIFTALLLTAIAIVIILGMYYREFRSGGKKKMVRMTIYLLFAVAIVVFVHHYAVERCIRTEAAQKGVRDVFQGIAQSRQINPTSVTIMGAGERPGASYAHSSSDDAPAEPDPPEVSTADEASAEGRTDNVGGDDNIVEGLADGLKIDDVVVT
jgi:Mn2+/Fe2+ NRAMP family transporter